MSCLHFEELLVLALVEVLGDPGLVGKQWEAATCMAAARAPADPTCLSGKPQLRSSPVPVGGALLCRTLLGVAAEAETLRILSV